MKHFTLLLCLFVLSGTAFASPFGQYRSGMINQCVDDGEQKAICTCVIDKLGQQVAPNEVAAAQTFGKYMSTGTDPNPSDIMKMQPLMMKMQSIGFECAQSAYVEEAQPKMDMGAMIPGLSGNQADLLNGMANGNMSDSDIMSQMRQLDAQQQAARDEKHSAREAEIKKEQDMREARRAKYQAAVTALETPSIESVMDHAVSDFKTAFMLRDGQESFLNCQWNALMRTAGTGKAGALTAYFATTSIDYDHPIPFRPYRDEYVKRYQSYQQAKETCYN